MSLNSKQKFPILPLSALSNAYKASFALLQVSSLSRCGNDGIILDVDNQKAANRGCYTGVIIRLVSENIPGKPGQFNGFIGFTCYPTIILKWEKSFYKDFLKIIFEKPVKFVEKEINYFNIAEQGDASIRNPASWQDIKYIAHKAVKISTLQQLVEEEVFEKIMNKLR